MDIDRSNTAVVITDPQNDFLSPDGVTWGLVGASVEENGTVDHIEDLLKAAKTGGYDVLISPHYYYPTDKGWEFGGTVEEMMHEIDMFSRPGALDLDGMSANLCVEAHLRELLEQGFEVAVVKDATAAAQHPELGDGYEAALTNFGFIANDVITTEAAVKELEA